METFLNCLVQRGTLPFSDVVYSFALILFVTTLTSFMRNHHHSSVRRRMSPFSNSQICETYCRYVILMADIFTDIILLSGGEVPVINCRTG